MHAVALAVLVATLACCAVSTAADGAAPFVMPPGHRAAALTQFAAAATDSAFCFISHGCWGGQHSPSQRAVAKLMADVAATAPSPVRFVIAAGDNFYKKGVKNLADTRFHETFEDIYTSPILDTVPFLAALGNHDYRGDFFAQVNYTTAQFERTGAGGGQPRGTGRWFMPHTYYSVKVAPDAVVVVLDGPLFERCHNNGNASPRCWDGGHQRQWATRELLVAHRGIRFKIVVCHYPLHANGPHINFPWLIEWLQPLMEQADVALYINADNHYLQVSHIPPVYYVNSGGGAGIGIRHTPHNKGYSRSKHDVFTDISDGVFLHCVTASRTALVSEAIRTDKKRLFTFTAEKPSGTGQAQQSAAGQQGQPSNSEPQRGSVDDARIADRVEHHGLKTAAVPVVTRREEQLQTAGEATFIVVAGAALLMLLGCVVHSRNGSRGAPRRK